MQFLRCVLFPIHLDCRGCTHNRQQRAHVRAGAWRPLNALPRINQSSRSQPPPAWSWLRIMSNGTNCSVTVSASTLTMRPLIATSRINHPLSIVDFPPLGGTVTIFIHSLPIGPHEGISGRRAFCLLNPLYVMVISSFCRFPFAVSVRFSDDEGTYLSGFHKKRSLIQSRSRCRFVPE